MSRHVNAMRLRGLIRKEFLQVLRDPSSIAIAFVMPVVLLVLFGYGVSLDPANVPVALIVEQPSATTSEFTSAFRHSPYFDPVEMADVRAAEQALMAHEVDGIIHLRADFAKRLKSGDEAPIQVLVNGVDANTARIVQGYAEGVWANWLEYHVASQGREFTPPLELRPRIWFNPGLRSRNYLVPGLIVIIMTLTGGLLTAMVMAREWERGTLEALMVTPVSMHEILIGKIVPYFVLGMGGMLLSLVMALWLFGVPLRGSVLALFATGSLFMLVALGMGLLISIVARSQFVAGMVALIATFLPGFLLSGFIFDIGSMPMVLQWLTHVVAARYFVAILQTLFLAGDVWSVILPNSLALLLMGSLFALLILRRAHKRLE